MIYYIAGTDITEVVAGHHRLWFLARGGLFAEI